MPLNYSGWNTGTFRGAWLGLLALGVLASQAATAGPIQLFEVDPDIVLVNFDSFTGGDLLDGSESEFGAGIVLKSGGPCGPGGDPATPEDFVGVTGPPALETAIASLPWYITAKANHTCAIVARAEDRHSAGAWLPRWPGRWGIR